MSEIFDSTSVHYQTLLKCPVFDINWYRTQYSDLQDPSVDPVAHYLNHGWREDRHGSAFFDLPLYRHAYRDLSAIDHPPLLHFWASGKTEGRVLLSRTAADTPNPTKSQQGPLGSLDSSDERTKNLLSNRQLLDLYLFPFGNGSSAGVDAGILRNWYDVLKHSEFFSEEWYLLNHPDVAGSCGDAIFHYITVGWKEHRRFSHSTSVANYVSRYSDLAELSYPALVHYHTYGLAEGRQIVGNQGRPSNAEASQLHTPQKQASSSAVVHSSASRAERQPGAPGSNSTSAIDLAGWIDQLAACPLFDEAWYTTVNDIDWKTYRSALEHYLVTGWRQNCDPSREFDTRYYLAHYSDLSEINCPALVHYWLNGRLEGRVFNSAVNFAEIQSKAYATKYHDAIEASSIGKYWGSAELENTAREEPELDFSVIIPTYNRVNRLPLVLDAWRQVDKFTRLKYEIIFSDDGSADGTPDFLDSVSDLPVRVLRNAHGGPAHARNAAIEASTGRRLLIVGDDIYPSENILEVHAKLSAQLGDDVAILGKVDWHDDVDVNHLMVHITEIGNEQFSYNRLKDNSFTDFRHFYTCNISIDRELIIRLYKRFDDQFDKYGFEDIEFGYRLALIGCKFYYSSSAFGFHYHPYTFKGFIRRQISAGDMAVTFAEIHPGVGHLLGISGTLADGDKPLPPDVVWVEDAQELIEALEFRCTVLEDLLGRSFTSRHRLILSSSLSVLYQQIFRVFFHFGVLQRKYPTSHSLNAAINLLVPLELISIFDTRSPQVWDADSLNEQDLQQVLRCFTSEESITALASASQILFHRELNALSRFWPTLHYPGIRAEQQHLPVCAVPALVLDISQDLAEDFVRTFRSAFPGYCKIYQIVGQRLFRDLETDSISIAPQLDATAYYWPDLTQSTLSADQLVNAYLALTLNTVSVALVGNSLATTKGVLTYGLRNSAIFSKAGFLSYLVEKLAGRGFKGTLLRLPPSPPVDTSPSAGDLATVFGRPVSMHANHFEGGGVSALVERQLNWTASLRHVKTKPVIFVFPAFLAVGGVERNTVEIIRQLSSLFDFIVVSFERLSSSQGSLAHQFWQVAKRTFDLPEFLSQKDYLDAIANLKEIYRPDLIWICNGCPWLIENAENIRQLFENCPIADQQVYDTREGWINSYTDPGIRSFDHFIAINSKIQQKFLGELGIPTDKVTLIYPAIVTGRLFASRAESTRDWHTHFNLPSDKRLIVFVGRLTDQKQPFKFIEIARRLGFNSSLQFVLVGNGELGISIDEYLRKEPCHNLARIPYTEDVIGLLSISSGIVFTSKYEGLPIALLEALSLGIPAFATDVGDIALVLERHTSGKVVPEDMDMDSMVAEFIEWVDSLPAYAKAAEASSGTILSEFSSETIALSYGEMFDGLIRNYCPLPLKFGKPLVSIIIPSYNHSRYIVGAIQSVLSQSYDNLELIVVDDGSTDNSLQKIGAISDARLKVVAQENRGAHAAINRGIELSSGELVAILNSDDLYHPERIEKCVRRLLSSDAELVCTWIQVIDGDGKILGTKEAWRNMLPWPIRMPNVKPIVMSDFAMHLLLSNFAATTSNIVFRRRLIKKIGSMRNLRFAHDWDFLLRAAFAAKCELIEDPLMSYRIHGANTISSNRRWMLFEVCWVIASTVRSIRDSVLFGAKTAEDTWSGIDLLLSGLNLQGNEKLLWVLSEYISSFPESDRSDAENSLLANSELRDKFLPFVVT